MGKIRKCSLAITKSIDVRVSWKKNDIHTLKKYMCVYLYVQKLFGRNGQCPIILCSLYVCLCPNFSESFHHIFPGRIISSCTRVTRILGSFIFDQVEYYKYTHTHNFVRKIIDSKNMISESIKYIYLKKQC